MKNIRFRNLNLGNKKLRCLGPETVLSCVSFCSNGVKGKVKAVP